MAKNTVAHAHIEFPQLLPVADQLIFVSVMLHRIANTNNKGRAGLLFFPDKTPIQHVRALKHVAQLMQEQNIIKQFCVMANAITFEFPEVQPEKPQTCSLFKGVPL